MKKCFWLCTSLLILAVSAWADVTPFGKAPAGYVGGETNRSVCDVTCPPNALLENEPDCYDFYRDSTNTGCNCEEFVPPTVCTFTDIECGDMYCGTSGTYLQINPATGDSALYRDTDWYRLVLTQPMIVTWSAVASFESQLLIISAGATSCYDQVLNFAYGTPCAEVNLTSRCLPAGTYYLWMGPRYFDGVPCGSDYYAWVSCEPCTYCESTPAVVFQPGTPTECQCAYLCPDEVTLIGVCIPSTVPPLVQVRPGCFYTDVNGCNVECAPAQFGYDPMGWYYDPANGCWINSVIGFTPGCVCICFDGWLPVEITSFDAVAGDHSVTLRWNTATETDIDRYEITRDHEVIAQINSRGNSTTGHNYSYTDNNVQNGFEYSYTLRSVDIDGRVVEHGSVNATPVSSDAATVTEFALHQNFPNPFNPTTHIAFDLAEASFVSLKVYNLAGQEVTTLVNTFQSAGSHSINFDGSGLASGVYLYRLTAGSFSADRKMLLMK